jgi:hypothetical protein
VRVTSIGALPRKRRAMAKVTARTKGIVSGVPNDHEARIRVRICLAWLKRNGCGLVMDRPFEKRTGIGIRACVARLTAIHFRVQRRHRRSIIRIDIGGRAGSKSRPVRGHLLPTEPGLYRARGAAIRVEVFSCDTSRKSTPHTPSKSQRWLKRSIMLRLRGRRVRGTQRVIQVVKPRKP